MDTLFKRSIDRMLASGRLPHTVILEDPDEERGLEAAQYLAAGAVCSGESKPCGRCRSCQKVKNGCHPDVTFLSGGTKTRSMPLEDARKLRADAFVSPGESPCKVCVISQAGFLSAACQNVLLKILEEPPGFVLFILICASRRNLLETVVSRGVVLSTAGEIAVDEALALQATTALFASGDLPFLQFLQANGSTREELLSVLAGLEWAFSQMLRGKITAELDGPAELKRLQATVSTRRILQLCERCAALSQQLSFYPNQSLMMTAVCSHLRAAAGL